MGLWKKLSIALGWTKVEAKVLVVGLDNSGKSTIINQLKPKKVGQLAVLWLWAALAATRSPVYWRSGQNFYYNMHLLQSTASEIVPTVGFSVERFSKGGMTFDAFDMSGVVRVFTFW